MTSEREARDLLDVAAAAARAAATLLRTARPAHIRSKAHPGDLVTEWDVRSEELIRTVLEERAPGIPVLGEEGGEPAAQAAGQLAAGLRWVVDPIDGTVNFAHGLPLWAISIALESPAGVLAGVVVAPALDWWFEASRGGGARDGTGVPLEVSATARVADALLVSGFPYDRATRVDNNFAEWDHVHRLAHCRRLGAASIDLCLVARGSVDGYWETRLQPWDLAAGALIVREAGGTVTDARGGVFDPHRGEVIATNGAIHGELIAELGRVRPAS